MNKEPVVSPEKTSLIKIQLKDKISTIFNSLILGFGSFVLFTFGPIGVIGFNNSLYPTYLNVMAVLVIIATFIIFRGKTSIKTKVTYVSVPFAFLWIYVGNYIYNNYPINIDLSKANDTVYISSVHTTQFVYDLIPYIVFMLYMVAIYFLYKYSSSNE